MRLAYYSLTNISTIFIINLQVIMATFIPKNARQILANSATIRDYFLKPYGLDAPTNKNFPKKHPEYKFFEKKIILRRPGKEVNDNILTFKADEKLAKPQIKQYLEKLYNLQIQKVNTVRYMGKVKRNPTGAPMITKNFKKVYVMTKHKIEPILNGVICN